MPNLLVASGGEGLPVGALDVTDDEHAAFDEFISKCTNEDRALRVMLSLAHDKLC